MTTQTDNQPEQTVNAESEQQAESGAKAFLRAVNNSWLRFPMLVVALVAAALFGMKARQLSAGILADVESLVDLLNIPF